MTINQRLFIDRLEQMIAIPSVSSTQKALDMGNRKVIEQLANWLTDLGFRTEIQALAGEPNKANLIATLGEGLDGLVFAGHTDTVPFDEELWQQNPFDLDIREGKAYGLGTADMKGFFPTVLAAIEPYLKKPLQHPIIILATADEETAMTGAKALTQQSMPHARYAVVGEPTGMQPIRLHKGVMMESVRITGSSGHSSNPSLGHNALDVMHDVITDLKQFRAELQSLHQHAGFAINIPTMNFGCIHGGDNPNRICGQCELEFDLRPLPGMGLDDLRQVIDKRLDSIADKNQIAIERNSIFNGIAAFEQPVDSPLVRAVERLSGHAAGSVAFGTEAPFLQNLGLDVVVMGPGSIDQAHQPDEYIDLAQLDDAVKMLQGLIEEFCL